MIFENDLTRALKSEAIRLAGLGYRVFPLAAGRKVPRRGINWREDATDDIERVEKWWSSYPKANIGLNTEDLLVLDIDDINGEWFRDVSTRPEIFETLAAAPVSLTPGGGRHYFFSCGSERRKNTVGHIAEKVDTRGEGGYVVVPPSTDINEKPYQWAQGMSLSDPIEDLQDPPEWLLAALRPKMDTPTTYVAEEAGSDIPDTTRSDTLVKLGGTMRRVGMTYSEIFSALSQTNKDRCKPPLKEKEVKTIAKSVARYEPDQVAQAIAEHHWIQSENEKVLKDSPTFMSAIDLCRSYPNKKDIVIDGLMRKGEIMTLISDTGVGKSWLAMHMALSVCTSLPWLGHDTRKGRTLIMDTELHPEELASRVPKVAEAIGLPMKSWQDGVFFKPLRGCVNDIFKMHEYFEKLDPGQFDVIILDALYRFIPKGISENDNAAMTQMFNALDHYAMKLNCSFVLVHHTSKGNQSDKKTTDAGAGAGAISRAADCHLVLREHKAEDCFGVTAKVRSFPPLEPFVVRCVHPGWVLEPELDPKELATSGNREKTYCKKELPVDDFVVRYITDSPRQKAELMALGNSDGISDYRVGKTLRKAEASKLIKKVNLGSNQWGYVLNK